MTGAATFGSMGGGTTVKRRLYATDAKRALLPHLLQRRQKATEHEVIEDEVERMSVLHEDPGRNC